jgi:DNA replication and repair protein RecF
MIDRLWVSTFRNIEKGLWEFKDVKRIGIIGKNGNGKSNFLESIYTLVNSKSFRGCPLSDLLPFEVSKFSLGMDTLNTRIYTEFSKEKGRVVEVSGQYSDMTALKRNIQISYFSSDIVRLLSESPDARRRELDRFCKQYFPEAAAVYSRYDAVLKQKNKSLKHQNSEMARIFHDQLSDIAGILVTIRQKGLAVITAKMSAYSDFFVGIKHLSKVGYTYISSTHESDFHTDDVVYSHRMKRLYDRYITAELAAGFSLYGPHRDDFILLLAGNSLSRFYSRGVNKISNILFRLSTYDLMKDRLGLPILLFDDVFAEVDDDNKTGVLAILEKFPQLFFTSLVYDDSFMKNDVNWYQIHDGVMDKI